MIGVSESLPAIASTPASPSATSFDEGPAGVSGPSPIRTGSIRTGDGTGVILSAGGVSIIVDMPAYSFASRGDSSSSGHGLRLPLSKVFSSTVDFASGHESADPRRHAETA